MSAGSLASGENDADLQLMLRLRRIAGRQGRGRLAEQVRKELGDLVWISGGGAWRTVDNGEGMFEDVGERERVVDARLLNLAVD